MSRHHQQASYCSTGQIIISLFQLTSKSMCPSSPLQNSRSFLETRVNQSLAIPMPACHMQRTESEVQLHEDNAVAEYRDQCMFNRVVRGTRHRQQQCDAGCSSSRDIHDSTHFSQDVGKVTPSGSGDLHRFQQPDAYYIEESMQMPCCPSQDMDDWAIDGFDDTVPMYNGSQGHVIPDAYESDEYSCYDDEVFDIDL